MIKRKAPSEDNPNQDFCEFLIELADYEKNVNRNVYKYNAYRKAASVLGNHPIKITSGKEAKKLNGVGEKIAKKIDEFLQTGKLQKLENIHKDESSIAINELTRVSGIGPAKAQSLFASGIKSLDDLKRNQSSLNHHQKVGLKHLEDFEKKIPRDEIQEIEAILKSEISKLDRNFTVTICGSYRRGKLESGDIDTLITHPAFTSKSKKIKQNYLSDIVDVLRGDLIKETLSLGETKFMGACKLGGNNDNNKNVMRRIDIRLIPYDQYFCGVLYFTGSDLFNKEMRGFALQEGFTLNEYSLRPLGVTGVPGEAVEISCEKDIFDCLGYPYKEPHERNK
nr:DNA polymerase beta-like isoform X2 [Onthophagus taurus]